MQFLHVPSLLLTLALLDLLMPVVADMILEGRRHRAVMVWCSGDLLVGLAMGLFALRGQVPDWASFPLPSVLMFVGVMVRIQSLRLDLGAPVSPRVMAAVTALFMLGHEGIRLGLQDLTIIRPGHADTLIEHRCTASLGVTLFKGTSGTAEDIFRQADQAMYRAKAGGRDQACVYV